MIEIFESKTFNLCEQFLYEFYFQFCCWKYFKIRIHTGVHFLDLFLFQLSENSVSYNFKTKRNIKVSTDVDGLGKKNCCQPRARV